LGRESLICDETIIRCKQENTLWYRKIERENSKNNTLQRGPLPETEVQTLLEDVRHQSRDIRGVPWLAHARAGWQLQDEQEEFSGVRWAQMSYSWLLGEQAGRGSRVAGGSSLRGGSLQVSPNHWKCVIPMQAKGLQYAVYRWWGCGKVASRSGWADTFRGLTPTPLRLLCSVVRNSGTASPPGVPLLYLVLIVKYHQHCKREMLSWISWIIIENILKGEFWTESISW
jgi:hypothetical protein